MAIPGGVILIWTGTNASIPTGWTRETSLDGKYPKGHGAENPNTSGGSNTHTHTSPSHSHTLSSHTHTIVTGWATSASWVSSADGSTPNRDHWHSHALAGATSDTISGAITYASANNEPPYYEVIFIKPSSANGSIKSGIVSYYNGSDVPDGWYYCDGNNSTPDLRGKYLKGAATGGNSGATSGGTSHSHTVDHTHTAGSHSHSGNVQSTGGTSGTSDYGTGDGSSKSQSQHYHATVLNSSSSGTVDTYTGTAGSAETVEPAYKKLGLIKCSLTKTYEGLVGMWLGSVASIPVNWQVCDGTNGTLDLTDKFIKTPDTLANNGDVGGSNTHTHAASNSHTHTATGTHTHTLSSFGNAQNFTGGSPGGNSAIREHSHSVSSIGTATSSWAAQTISADSSSNQPAYLTVAYIQLMKVSSGGGSFLLNLI